MQRGTLWQWLLLTLLFTGNYCFANKTGENKKLFSKVIRLNRSDKVDSSLSLCKQLKAKAYREKDTAYIIKSHLELSNIYYWGFADYHKTKLELDTAGKYFFDKMSLHQKSYYHSRLGDAIYYDFEYVHALENYFKAMDYAILGSDSGMLLRTYHNIGWVYSDINMYDKAVEYGMNAVELAQKMGRTGSKEWEGVVYIHQTFNDFDKAEYALNMAIKSNTNPSRVPFHCMKKSSLKGGLGQLDSAIFYAKLGVWEAKKNRDEKLMRYNLSPLIRFMCLSGQVDSLYHYLDIYEKVARKNDVFYKLADSYYWIGQMYYRKKEYDSTWKYLEKSQKLQQTYNADDHGEIFNLLAKIQSEKGDYKQANTYLNKYIDYLGKIIREDSIAFTKSIAEQVRMYELEDVLTTKNIEIQAKELQLKNEKYRRNAFIAGFVFTLVVASISIYAFIQKRRSHRILNQTNILVQEKNEELNQQNEEILTQRDEIERQRKILEQRNQEVGESISAAERIQMAFFKEEDREKKLLPPHFVIFKPRDVVSGDFYWSYRTGTYHYISVADCTGHGVPGALMSMLGLSLIKDVFKDDVAYQPAEILNHLRSKLILELNQDLSDKNIKEGMDISIVRLDTKSGEITYAGANNDLYYVENQEIKIIKADKQSISISENMKDFKNHSIPTRYVSRLFLFSDGYPDQFGGVNPEKKSKKIGYKRFRKILLEASNLPLEEQKEKLESFLYNWMKREEQIDDICVIGIDVSTL